MFCVMKVIAIQDKYVIAKRIAVGEVNYIFDIRVTNDIYLGTRYDLKIKCDITSSRSTSLKNEAKTKKNDNC